MKSALLFIGYPTQRSVKWMFVTAVLGLILGLVMLFYPGGTMSLMRTGFRVFQVIISGLVFYFCLTEAVPSFREGNTARGAVFILLAIVAMILIWVLKVSLIYYVLAFFLAVFGLTEIIGAFRAPQSKFFLALLGIIDLLVAVIIVLNPVILAYLVAWYVLFWGLSRLFLALEFRKVLREPAPHG
jgi:uncharacterized membrane protein HdeD (DUF308 family)